MSYFLEMLQVAFSRNVPAALSGNYCSVNSNYLDLVERYYPADGKIIIDSFEIDKHRYANDLHVSVKDAKRVVRRYTVDKELLEGA